MKKASRYNVSLHGIESSDHFQGAGTEDFDAVFTGIGRSAKEALEDAAEQAAGSEWELPEALDKEIEAADADSSEIEEMELDVARAELEALLDALVMGKAQYLSHTLENAEIAEEDVEEYAQDALEGHMYYFASIRLSEKPESLAALRPIDIPKDFPVKPLKPGDPAKDKATCGECGLSWDDAVATSYTPAPAARCPFEHFHE